MVGSTIKVVATAENGNTFESEATEEVGVYDYVTLVSAEQSGTKTIRVEFSDAVTVDDKLTVFKGTAEVAIEDIDYDGDFEGATLTMKDKITEAEYTVVLTPEDGEPTEATFDGEVSELGTIEFLNNYLILADNTYQKGYAYVKGYDQFGTEINLAGLTVTCGVGDMTAYDSKTGKITLESDTDNAYMFIKQVPVFVSYQTGEGIISAQANLEVSTRAFVDEIEFGEIKKDGNAREDGRLTITELASKKYYVELTTVKDQYGNDLSYKDLNKMVADNVMFVIPGENNGAYYTTNGFDEIDGTTVLWLAPVADPKPGSMDLSITGAGGYTASTPVEVEDDPYIQTISITYPQLYAGHSKSADLAFTAIDQYGEEVNMWDVRPVVDPNDATGKTLKFSDKNHMTGKSTEVKLSGDITYNAVIEDTVAKSWTVNINAAGAQAKNMAVVTTLTAGMVPYTKTITIGAQGNAINVLGKLTDNSKLELNPRANTEINFNKYLQFEDVNGEVMDRISSEMYPTFSADKTIVLNETDSNVKMSDYTDFYWYLSESELPATSAYTLAGTAQAAGATAADNRTTNPVIDGDGVVENTKLAAAKTSSKKYYVTVVGYVAAKDKYYKLSEQDFRVTYIPAEDVKDGALGNVVRKDTDLAGTNNFDPSATTNKYSAKLENTKPIYVNADNGTTKKVRVTVTNETGETYELTDGDGYRVSTDSGLKIVDGYKVSGAVSGPTSGTATLDVWLVDNDKKIDTITVDYTNADPVPTSVEYKGIQSVANSKVASKVGATFKFDPATRVETSKNTTKPATVTAKDGSIVITNANRVLDNYTAQVKDQYDVDWTKAEYYVNGKKVEWKDETLTAGKEYVFKMIAGTVTKEITVVPGVDSTATVEQTKDYNKNITVASSATLVNAAAQANTKGTTTITLAKDITLEAPLVIEKGVKVVTGGFKLENDNTGDGATTGESITVKPDGALEVSTGGLLVTKEAFTNSGDVVVNGTWEATAAITNNKKVTGSGHVTLNGIALTQNANGEFVVTGSTLELMNTASISGGKVGGHVAIAAGATAKLDSLELSGKVDVIGGLTLGDTGAVTLADKLVIDASATTATLATGTNKNIVKANSTVTLITKDGAEKTISVDPDKTDASDVAITATNVTTTAAGVDTTRSMAALDLTTYGDTNNDGTLNSEENLKDTFKTIGALTRDAGTLSEDGKTLTYNYTYSGVLANGVSAKANEELGYNTEEIKYVMPLLIPSVTETGATSIVCGDNLTAGTVEPESGKMTLASGKYPNVVVYAPGFGTAKDRTFNVTYVFEDGTQVKHNITLTVANFETEATKD